MSLKTESFPFFHEKFGLCKVLGQGQNETFSEYVHVAYQIKGNEVYDNMAAIILLSHTSSIPGMESESKNIVSL